MNPDLLGWLSAALLLLGGFVGLIGAIGVLRLPDCYTRMHSASKAGALGAALVLAGVAAASSGSTIGTTGRWRSQGLIRTRARRRGRCR